MKKLTVATVSMFLSLSAQAIDHPNVGSCSGAFASGQRVELTLTQVAGGRVQVAADGESPFVLERLPLHEVRPIDRHQRPYFTGEIAFPGARVATVNCFLNTDALAELTLAASMSRVRAARATAIESETRAARAVPSRDGGTLPEIVIRGRVRGL